MTDDGGGEGEGDEPRNRGSIGLALSGGGHRATIFALGAMIYLHRVGALGRIKAISSVSGGSILNGYLGLLGKPLAELDETEFSAVASRLARCIAGDPSHWRDCILMLAVTIAGFTLGLAYVSPTVLIGAAVLGIVTVAMGPRSGGSLWGWWGTWTYVLACLLLLSSVAVTFGWFLLEFDPRALAAVVLMAFLFGFLLRQRGQVAGLAFGAVVGRLARLGAAQAPLTSLRSEIRHVICATELHSGRHCYLARDFVYCPGIGAGHSDGIAVWAAVQASAAFPGAFPFARIPTSRIRFCVWDMLEVPGGPRPALIDGQVSAIDKIDGLPRVLLLSDGGVSDNLGLSWFTSAERAGRGIDRWLLEMQNNYSPLRGGSPEVGSSLRQSIDLGWDACSAMRSKPDVTIVVNAGAPRRWNSGALSWLWSVSEIAELYTTVIATYSELQDQMVARFEQNLLSGDTVGAIIELDKVGVRRGSYMDKITDLDRRWDAFLESLPWPRTLIGDLDAFAKADSAIATTLNPLGCGVTANLLNHGFIQAMACLHVQLGLPLVDVPERSFFEEIASRSSRV